MAMVRITNGETTSRVPYSAYISYYKKIGFVIDGEEEPIKSHKEDAPVSVEDTNEQTEDENAGDTEDDSDVVTGEDDSDEQDDVDEDEAFVEDILEKPLSQWTPDELKKFAEIKDIDTSKAKKVSEARAIIKKYLDEQAKAQA